MDKIETVRSWLLSRVGNPYLMGGTGQPCTVSYRKARAQQYPGSAAKIKNNCPQMRGEATNCKGCKYYDDSTGQGKRAYDCAQLVRWAMDAVGIKMVSGATSQWRNTRWMFLGDMGTLPADKLVILYRMDADGRMGHTGIALGDGSCIHAKGHDYGVVRDGIADYGRWTHWGIPEGLYMGEAQPQGDMEEYEVTGVRVALRRGMSTATELIPPRINTGTIVKGVPAGSDWIYVTHDGRQGYMMAEYLRPVNEPGDAEDVQEEPPVIPVARDVVITLDKDTADELQKALQNALERG